MSVSQRLVLFSCLLFSLASHSEVNPIKQEIRIEIDDTKKVESDRIYKGQVSYTLMGRRFDDPFVNSRWGRAIIDMSLSAEYENWFEANLSVAQLLSSGSASYQLGVTEAGPSNGLFLNEATVAIKPFDFLTAKAGVIEVQYNPIISMFTTQGQAGGSLRMSHSNDTNMGVFKVHLEGSQSIPTVSRGSVITDEGTNPLLTLGTLSTELKNEDSGTRARLSATHFEYTDLSTATAADSLRTGSTVVGNKDFQFAYEFRGKEYAAAIDQQIALSHEIRAKASLISNERAPKGLRDGYQYRLEYARTFNKWKIIPGFTQFRVEGDALPSLYAIGSYGYTNREGYNLAVKIEIPKQKVNVFTGYTNAKAINKNGVNANTSQASTYQADREIFTLGAEVKYDIF